MPRPLHTQLNQHLTDERFIRFLEHVLAGGDTPRSARYLLDRIVELGSVKAALDEADEPNEYTSTVLRITPRGANRFRIRFGVEGQVGDGGEWTVLYLHNNEVRRIIPHRFWTC